MLPPTRANLLLLKDKAAAVASSRGLLRSRRRALIHELLACSVAYLASRDGISRLYAEAIGLLAVATGQEGGEVIASLVPACRRDFRVQVRNRRLWGLSLKEIESRETARRQPDRRGHDEGLLGPATAAAIDRFEAVVDALIEFAAHDNKLARLAEEIGRTTRRLRVLEERLLPAVQAEIRGIGQALGEREREELYRRQRCRGRAQEER
ncbi:MAG: V-type ATP synthase subunit D [Thermodesulfobacteriota bacterium]